MVSQYLICWYNTWPEGSTFLSLCLNRLEILTVQCTHPAQGASILDTLPCGCGTQERGRLFRGERGSEKVADTHRVKGLFSRIGHLDLRRRKRPQILHALAHLPHTHTLAVNRSVYLAVDAVGKIEAVLHVALRRLAF